MTPCRDRAQLSGIRVLWFSFVAVLYVNDPLCDRCLLCKCWSLYFLAGLTLIASQKHGFRKGAVTKVVFELVRNGKNRRWWHKREQAVFALQSENL